MLQSIISNKVQKSKQNIEIYLSNSNSTQSQQQQSSTQPTVSQSTVRPTQQSTSFHNQNTMTSSSSQPKNKLAKNQIEVKIMNVAGQQFTKEGMYFKFSKEEGKFQFLFQELGVKTKLEGKRDSLLGGKRVKPNIAQGSCIFQIKQAMYRKQDLKETAQKGQGIWTNGKQVNEYTVGIWVKDKQHLKQLIQSPFMEGLVDPNPTANQYTEQPKNVQLLPVQQANDMEQDHSHVKLVPPTPAQQPEVQKIRKIIKQMKQQDKTTVLIQVFKIKKQYEDPTSIIKKLKCPVNFCIYCQKKSYKDVQQLKNHLKIKHPELSKHGIELSEYDGTFQYGSKAMDLALFIGKMYPQEMKKIIKQMKTKQPE